MTKTDDMTGELVARDGPIRKVFADIYGVGGKDAAYEAVAVVGVDCAMRLFNVLRAMRQPGTGSTHRAMMDLMVGLNGNPLWQKHGNGLVPLLHMAGQAQADYAILRAEKAANPKATANDALLNESQLVGIELFTMIAYILGGQEYMSINSIEIKKKLVPYFTD